MTFLGIDIGTSSVKAVLVDERGAIAGQASHPLTVSRPHSFWSEQEPDNWWHAAQAAVLSLDDEARKQVRAIDLSGQMHGATLLGADDKPLRPAILWNDGRCAAECADIETEVPQSRSITGNIAKPRFTAPKLAWVRKHEPELFAKVETVLLPKDYVRLWCCQSNGNSSPIGAMRPNPSSAQATRFSHSAKAAERASLNV